MNPRCVSRRELRRPELEVGGVQVTQGHLDRVVVRGDLRGNGLAEELRREDRGVLTCSPRLFVIEVSTVNVVFARSTRASVARICSGVGWFVGMGQSSSSVGALGDPE